MQAQDPEQGVNGLSQVLLRMQEFTALRTAVTEPGQQHEILDQLITAQ